MMLSSALRALVLAVAALVTFLTLRAVAIPAAAARSVHALQAQAAHAPPARSATWSDLAFVASHLCRSRDEAATTTLRALLQANLAAAHLDSNQLAIDPARPLADGDLMTIAVSLRATGQEAGIAKFLTGLGEETPSLVFDDVLIEAAPGPSGSTLAMKARLFCERS